MIERTLENNERLDCYGLLLSDRQRAVMEDYFLYDLSLMEIAEKYNVTKQAISDTIRRSEHHLDTLEHALGLVKRTHDMERWKEEMGELIEELRHVHKCQELAQRLQEKLEEVSL